jgi:hypothetical protein
MNSGRWHRYSLIAIGTASLLQERRWPVEVLLSIGAMPALTIAKRLLRQLKIDEPSGVGAGPS